MTSTTHPVTPEQVQNILLVEDDLDLIAFLKNVIKQTFPQANVESASNIEDALRLLNVRQVAAQKSPYDLLLADIILDGPGSGLDVWRLCRSLFPDMHMLLTSSLPETKIKEVIHEEKQLPLIMKKPFTIDECKRLLQASVYRN